MKVHGQLLNIINPDNNYDKNSFYSEKELNKDLKKIKNSQLGLVGKDIFNTFIETRKDFPQDLKNSFTTLYRVFFEYIKDDGVGICNTEEFRPGYARIIESLPFPSDLIKGTIKGLVEHYNLKGFQVKQTKEKNEHEKFNEYIVSWMVTHV